MPGTAAKRRRSLERRRVEEVVRRLRDEYPDAECALRFENPFQLLVATVLSAQCTDERVNRVTPDVFSRFPEPFALAEADHEDLEELIRSTGFFRNKARNLIGAARMLAGAHDGRVPENMEELLQLPGVARKTANVVLGTAFGIPSGVVVDTHVKRVSRRLGLTAEENPTKIEKNLMDLLPREEWIDFSHRLIHHGRRVCKAQRPRCDRCVLVDLCPFPAASGKVAASP